MAIRFKLKWRDKMRGGSKTAEVLVSNEDAWLLRQHFYRVNGHGRGPSRAVLGIKNGGSVYLAREIMGADDTQDVIHLNGDHLDCRRSNLAVVDRHARRVMQGHLASLAKRDKRSAA